MKHKYVASLAVLSLLFISACSPENNIPEPVKKAETKVETPTIADRDIREISVVQASNYDPTLKFFIMSFDLKSNPGQPDKKYNETSPAMPLLTNGLAVFLDEGAYKFQLRSVDGTSESVSAGNTEDWTNVRIVNLADSSTLIVDGKVVLTGSRARPLSSVTFGKGFKSRVWTGELADYKVCAAPVPDQGSGLPESMFCPDET